MLFLVTCYNSDSLLHSISQIVGTIGQHGSISPISSERCTLPQPLWWVVIKLLHTCSLHVNFFSDCSKEIRSLHRHKKHLHNTSSERNQQLPKGERGKTSIEIVRKLLQFSIWKVLIVNKKLLLLICDFSCGRKTKTTAKRGLWGRSNLPICKAIPVIPKQWFKHLMVWWKGWVVCKWCLISR